MQQTNKAHEHTTDVDNIQIQNFDKKEKGIITKATEDVVEVIEIIVALFQHCFVALCVIDQSVGIGHCACTERERKKEE